jgi:hypothetical protein
MRWFGLLCSVLFVTALLVPQTGPPSFEFSTKVLPSGAIDKPYEAIVQVAGGTSPFLFRISQGKVPPGIILQQDTGALNGTPTAAGTYDFRISVVDASGKTITREFRIEISDYLVAQWKQPPTLDSNTISGSLLVSNGSQDRFDLTVIVVAVNEVGKAFALGYQRLNLNPAQNQVIPFSSTLPNGKYIVHADAVAEVSTRHLIHRVHLQTSGPMTVNVNR